MAAAASDSSRYTLVNKHIDYRGDVFANLLPRLAVSISAVYYGREIDEKTRARLTILSIKAIEHVLRHTPYSEIVGRRSTLTQSRTPQQQAWVYIRSKVPELKMTELRSILRDYGGTVVSDFDSREYLLSQLLIYTTNQMI